MQQRTIKKAVEVIGIGLHKGEPIKLRLEPLSADAGIIFYREDLAMSIPLSPDSVIDTRMATVIGSEKGYISTIEHFLSALYAYGIDNLRVIVDGNEMPIMDGSSISFCLLLDEAGVQELDAPKKVIRVKEPVEVQDGDKFVRLLPHDFAKFDFRIKFDHPVIGEQSESFDFSTHNFIEEIARARTFGFAKDIQYLQSQNLALGATLQNAIGLDDHKVLNPEGLRVENEFVRHKVLDAIGDMSLAGAPIIGHYYAYKSGHKLNQKLLKKLFSRTSTWTKTSLEQGRKMFANHNESYDEDIIQKALNV